MDDGLVASFADFHQGLPTIIPNFGFDSTLEDQDGKMELHRAVISKDVREIDRLLSAGVAIDVRDSIGNQALHYGVTSASLPVVVKLLQYGADVNSKGLLGRSPLHMAVTISDVGIVETLLREPVIVSDQDDEGDTPLHLAISNDTGKDTPIIRSLLKALPDLDLRNRDRVSAFHKILDRPYSDDRRSTNDTPQNILLCIRQGADISAPLHDGRSPLESFLSRSKLWSNSRRFRTTENEIIREFLERGCSPTTPMSSGDPLVTHYFSKLFEEYDTDKDLAKLFCKVTDTNHILSASQTGDRILHLVLDLCKLWYFRNDNDVPEMIRTLVTMLLDKGADPNSQGGNGDTPLLRILQKSMRIKLYEESMRALLAHGCNIWSRSQGSDCALTLAAKNPKLHNTILKPFPRS